MKQFLLGALLALWGGAATAQTIGCPPAGTISSGASICPPPCCVLSSMSVPASAAYSLNRVNVFYSGPVINVRRSTDNTAMDIATVRNTLDTATLLSFCSGSSTNCFVTDWYDQSGSGYNAAQATAASQPQIVANGVLETLNGKPAIYFGGSEDLQTAQAQIVSASTGTWTTNAVVQDTGASGNVLSQDNIFRNRVAQFINFSATAAGAIAFGAAVYSASITVLSYPAILTSKQNGTSVALWQNGTAGTPTAVTGPMKALAEYFTIGASAGGGSFMTGYANAVFAFPSALSTADQQTLEHYEESTYGIAGI